VGLSETEIPLKELFSKTVEANLDQIQEIVTQKASMKTEISPEKMSEFLLLALKNKKVLKEFTELHTLLRKFLEQED